MHGWHNSNHRNLKQSLLAPKFSNMFFSVTISIQWEQENCEKKNVSVENINFTGSFEEIPNTYARSSLHFSREHVF